MRNDTDNWTAVRSTAPSTAQSANLASTRICGLKQTLISGPIDRTLNKLALQTATGWPEIALGSRYALRTRRDQLLVIGDCNISDGWHDDLGLAVSDVSGSFVIVELEGSGVSHFINQGTEFHFDAPSASVSRFLNGLPIYFYRWNNNEKYRIHIERALIEAFWQALENAECVS